MENEYKTKEMKPTETKVKVPKIQKDGDIYEEGGRYKFKIEGQVYQYKTKELAKAGLLIVNG